MAKGEGGGGKRESKYLRSSRHTRVYDARIATALGSATAATILQQIHYHLEWKARETEPHEDGKYWWRSTLNEWIAEFPYLSESTLRRALAKCEEEGLVLVKRVQTNFGISLFYSLDYPKIEALGDSVEEKNEGEGDVQFEQHPLSKRTEPPVKLKGGSGQNEHLLIEHLETSEKASEPRRPAGRRARFPLEALQKQAAEKSPEEYQRDAREKHRAKALSKLTVENAILVWKSLLADYSISSLSKSFTIKERGMMKNLLKHFTEHANGSGGKALSEFLEFAISHWAELRKKIVWDNNPKRSRLNERVNFLEVYFAKDDILHYMKNPQEVKKAEDKKEIYTDVSQVPVSHPHYKLIKRQIERTGKAVLSH